MCDGGGGGGDGGAAEREAERQRRQDEAVAKIDELFGIDRPDLAQYQTPAVVAPVQAPAATQQQRKRRAGPPRVGGYEDESSQQSGDDSEPRIGGRPMSIFRPRQATEPSKAGWYSKSKADENKAARDALYGTVRQDVIDYFRPDLDKQKTDAERALRFSLAGRGLTSGSVDVDQGRELQDRYLKGILALTNKGDAAANEMRGADSRTRLDMISRINAGADAGTAVSSAMNEMDANARSARDAALGQNLNSFFDDMIFLQRAKSDYLNNQQLQNSFGNFFRAPSGGGNAATGSVTSAGY